MTVDNIDWHLDKRVPIAIIAALLFQTGSVFWFASNISTRVDVLERRVDNQSERINKVDDGVDRLGIDLAEINGKLEVIVEKLTSGQFIPPPNQRTDNGFYRNSFDPSQSGG